MSPAELVGWAEILIELKGGGQVLSSSVPPVDDPTTLVLPDRVREALARSAS